MAIIYAVVGIVFFLLFASSPTGVPGNILNALPSNSFYNIVVSILMVVTCIGGFPLYMGPAHEVVEGDWGEMTSNKYFITNKRYILFRVIEIILISIVAALVPSFSDILGFNILCVFDSV
ncbi:hypothetical protein JH06_2881 [Blastocystis sp. subtype 4]|uniref:hypothetical protein n=1 Tax=Blastocystis sp. subtype 4 TaxID=944170 RepID=UPI00071161EA|nr:hypothetical protein JH06_2881 [Blastocystis sp. subtype 4]KNB43323.1 hypothetical protein JH06_2881 [Blastocystis sp. subtype 4]|eukprot:XP_014526766.1 hypothetical protein JH06_2881 [Blastocystis sp. subtype 4]